MKGNRKGCMIKKAFLFPGQGTNFRKVISELYDDSKIFRQTIQEASEYANMNLYKGYAEQNRDVVWQNRQLYVVVTGVAAFRTLYYFMEKRPEYMAGHSLGEITALTCAGSISLKQAVEITVFREKEMLAASEKVDGTMVSVIFHTPAALNAIEEACKQYAGEKEIVSVGLYNSNQQVVLSGHTKVLKELTVYLNELGYETKILQLPGAFHSQCMCEVQRKLEDQLRNYEFRLPDIAVVSWITGKPYECKEDIKPMLARQLTAPVLWNRVIQYLECHNVGKAFEISSAGYLRNISGNNNRFFEIEPVCSMKEIKKVVEWEKNIPNMDIIDKNRSITFLKNCLLSVICTKNKILSEQQYEHNVVAPYRKIQRMLDDVKAGTVQMNNTHILEIGRSLYSILSRKGLSEQEAETQVKEIFYNCGLGHLN